MGSQIWFRNFALNRNFYEVSRILLFKRGYAADFGPIDEPEIPDVALLDEKPMYADTNVGLEIEKKRNKSGLNEEHRRILNGEPPYDEEFVPWHRTLTYKRKLLGKYGLEMSNVPAGIAWPTKDELEDRKEYESVMYPLTLREAWAEIARRREEKAAAVRARDEQLAKNMLMVDKWRSELKARVEKKAADVAQAKARKERMIEEVRRHFGFQVSMKDERFKLMLQKIEKEDKKKKKEEKRQEKAAKMMAKILAKSADKLDKEGSAQPVGEVPKDAPASTS